MRHGCLAGDLAVSAGESNSTRLLPPLAGRAPDSPALTDKPT